MNDTAAPRPAPTRFANLALGLDAAYCNVVGLVFTLTGGFMSDWLGIPGWVAVGFGIAVMAWALVITLYANRRVARSKELDRVIVINIGFLIAAALIIVLPGPLSDGGRRLLLIGSIPVVAFVIAQIAARGSTRPASTEEAQ